MIVITGPQGAPVSRSRNLRGILTYARKHGVEYAQALKTANGASLYIRFGDKAIVAAPFADYSVCVGFVKARRSWGKPIETRDAVEPNEYVTFDYTGGV